jgi:hypothetical protein
MPKFHFEIIDGYKIEDPVGLDCKSTEQAKEIAVNIAKQIAVDIGPEVARRMVDDDGTEIYKVPVKP